jgi:type IV secretion system protein VirB11
MSTGSLASAETTDRQIPPVEPVEPVEPIPPIQPVSPARAPAPSRHAPAINPGEALIARLSPILPFLAMDGTTDVAINRPGELWVENDTGWHRYDVEQLDLPTLKTLAQMIGTFNKQSVDEKKPSLSGMLPNGERVQVIVPPAVEPNRVSITIRKPSGVLKTRSDYERDNLTDSIVDVTAELGPTDNQLIALRNKKQYWDFMELAVREKRNIVISGATGSGKTTLSKTLASFIETHERLVTIEDVREIELPKHPNVAYLLYSAGSAGTTQVQAKELLQACLRMKPSRILLAEIRSKVAYDYIVNVSSGHPGSITTVHAGSCREAFEMLALRMLESPEGRGLSREGTMGLLRSKIDIIIQLNVVESRQPDGSIQKLRRITEIYHDPTNKSAWQ